MMRPATPEQLLKYGPQVAWFSCGGVVHYISRWFLSDSKLYPPLNSDEWIEYVPPVEKQVDGTLVFKRPFVCR